MKKLLVITGVALSVLLVLSIASGCEVPAQQEVAATTQALTTEDTRPEDESAELESGDTASEVESVEEQITEEVMEEETGEEPLPKEGEVTFMTEDNVELNGNIFGSGKKWIILSHMFPTDQTSWFEFAEILKENDYTVLTYDFRGYGKSEGPKDVSKLDIDLTAALAYIKQYDPELIYLMGGSMGGTASLFVASQERIDGVISFSSPEEWEGISAISVMGEIIAPKLFIASKGDTGAANSAAEMYEKSMEPKQLEILDGDSHGTFIFEEEPENAEKLKEIVLFFLY